MSVIVIVSVIVTVIVVSMMSMSISFNRKIKKFNEIWVTSVNWIAQGDIGMGPF